MAHFHQFIAWGHYCLTCSCKQLFEHLHKSAALVYSASVAWIQSTYFVIIYLLVKVQQYAQVIA